MKRSIAVFLDRDGVINRKAPDGEYVTRPGDLELLPGAAAAIAALNSFDLTVVIVTNQRGIALGRMTEGDLTAIHARLLAELAGSGAHVDAIYHCPHHHGECRCRKPASGMLLRAASDMSIDLLASTIVGDSLSDVEAGIRVGTSAILLRDVHTASAEEATAEARAYEICDSLAAAVPLILG